MADTKEVHDSEKLRQSLEELNSLLKVLSRDGAIARAIEGTRSREWMTAILAILGLAVGATALLLRTQELRMGARREHDTGSDHVIVNVYGDGAVSTDQGDVTRKIPPELLGTTDFDSSSHVLMGTPRNADSEEAAAMAAAPPEPSAATAVVAAEPFAAILMGVPTSSADDEVVLQNSAYTVGFSRATRTPLWVAYRLFAVDESVDVPRPSIEFDSDDRIKLPDLTHGSYTNSGFDRGHMAPSSPIGRCYGEDAQRETFIVSNICPQAPGCNQRAWERFEHRESHDYASWFGVIWVVDGPIFDSNEACEELLSDVRIPNSFYKIVVAKIDGKWEALAIEMQNARTERSKISEYVTTVDDIEGQTGLDFFHDLPDEVEVPLESDDTPHSRWAINYELQPTFPGAYRSVSKRPCN